MAINFRFVHMADVHLGKQQYGRIERAADFARAFRDVVKHAVDAGVDFVVIAGDLFEQKTVDPETFNVASAGLRRLAEANIPVFAIEGNHEKFLRHGARTWVWYLGQQGLLRLLDIGHENGEVAIRPWRADTGGTYFDLDGVRIFGIGYYGARLPRIVGRFADLAAEIPSSGIEHSICLLHTGVDDKVDYLHSGCTAAELLVLDRVIDYVALGHVHHHFSLPDGPDDEPLLFNPGALENWSSREVGQAKGFFDVAVDTTATPKQRARHVSDVAFCRKYLKLEIDVSMYSAPDELAEAIAACAETHLGLRSDRPIVELRLAGLLRFERGLIEPALYETILKEKLDSLVSRVVLDTVRREIGDSGASDLERTRGDIEADVLKQIFEQYDDFAPHADKLAAVASRLKSESIQSDSPESLVEALTSELERAGILDVADN